MPRWDFSKFELAKRKLSSAMKSVGEVMAIGRNFEEVLQKAIRMSSTGKDGLVANGTDVQEADIERIEQALLQPNDEIIYTVVQAMKAGMSIERIYQLSAIDPWFLQKIRNIVDMEDRLKKQGGFDEGLVRQAKKIGFSDRQISRCNGTDEMQVRALREKFGIKPAVKQIDTLAAEWPAKTNYLYLTYGGDEDDVAVKEAKDKSRMVVLGAGPYRIGSSVEFDWGTVNMVWGLKENGVKEISVINCNPETVSTDYDICDRLYFEELTLERVLDICDKEHPTGIVTCVGGQTANNLTPKLAKNGIKIIGTASEDVDRAEDRAKFGQLLDSLGIKQPAWRHFTNLAEAKEFAETVGYPVLVRPSYVLSGVAMKVVWAEKQLERFLTDATNVNPEHPVVISKFLQDAAEVEVDAVSNGKDVLIGAIIEHIDNAGVHSGDAMMSIPPWRLDRHVMETITDYSVKIGRALNVKGPLNIQYLVKDEQVLVIEANVRASRSMPFVSKFAGVNIINMAARAMLGRPFPAKAKDLWLKAPGFGVKVPQFSFMQLEGSDIVLGVEMQSTGEVACFGNTFYDALSKSYMAAGYSLPLSGSVLITIGGQKNKEKLLPLISMLAEMNYKILATEHTAEFMENNSVKDVELVHKISEPDRKPNIADMLYERKLDFIINIPATSTLEKYVGMLQDEYLIRRKAVEMGVPVLTTVESASSFIKTLQWLRSNTPTLGPLKNYAKLA